jgi:hypothetical protein
MAERTLTCYVSGCWLGEPHLAHGKCGRATYRDSTKSCAKRNPLQTHDETVDFFTNKEGHDLIMYSNAQLQIS